MPLLIHAPEFKTLGNAQLLDHEVQGVFSQKQLGLFDTITNSNKTKKQIINAYFNKRKSQSY
jgi:hypothetical protein